MYDRTSTYDKNLRVQAGKQTFSVQVCAGASTHAGAGNFCANGCRKIFRNVCTGVRVHPS